MLDFFTLPSYLRYKNGPYLNLPHLPSPSPLFVAKPLFNDCSLIMFNTIFTFKAASKLHFMYYSCVIIVLFSTDLCNSALSTYSFKNLVFSFLCSLSSAGSVLNSMSSLQTYRNICLIDFYVAKCFLFLFPLYINCL